MADVCTLKLRGATPEKVAMAVQRKSKRADIRVAYELLLDHKKAKIRKEGGEAGRPHKERGGGGGEGKGDGGYVLL